MDPQGNKRRKINEEDIEKRFVVNDIKNKQKNMYSLDLFNSIFF